MAIATAQCAVFPGGEVQEEQASTKRIVGALIAVLVVIIVVAAVNTTFTSKKSPGPTSVALPVQPDLPTREEKLPCPIKLSNAHLVTTKDEPDLSVKITNAAKASIDAVGLGLRYRDNLGIVLAPYKTLLEFDHVLRPGQSLTGSWSDIFMSPSDDQNGALQRGHLFTISKRRQSCPKQRALLDFLA